MSEFDRHEHHERAGHLAPAHHPEHPEGGGERVRVNPTESLGNVHQTIDGIAAAERATDRIHTVINPSPPLPSSRPAATASVPPGSPRPAMPRPAPAAPQPAVPEASRTGLQRVLASPVTENALRVAGGALGVRDVYNGVNQTRTAIQNNNAEDATQGALTTVAGGGAIASAIVPALGPAAAVPAIASTTYNAGRQVNDASGEAMEYFGIGGLRSTPGRGVNAPNEVRTDNRRISDRVADAWHGATLGAFDDMARDLSPHLPVALGGEEMPTEVDARVGDGTRRPTSREIEAQVRAETPEILRRRDAENARHASDMSPGANAIMDQLGHMTPAEAQQARAAIARAQDHGHRRPDGTIWIDTPSYHGPVHPSDVPTLLGSARHMGSGGSPVVDPETQRDLRAQHAANQRAPRR